ncbi:MAG: DEAD/DEAH box helicase [Hyphomicrobiaceae bacterium]|nr:DEAD/DEAH box helicase [Hyphomicrobiaceae bacterium]
MTTKTFAELGLSPKLLAAIEATGYTAPTPIQADGIPVALSGCDILGIAQTGTGKTAAFTIPMIARLETGRARARMPRSLILAPTRELAAQVAQSFERYGINHKLTVALLIGGVSMDDQVKKLDRGVDVLIATPGRLLDHFQRGRVMLMGVEILVIDEADRMLDMGFIPDIEKICRLLPPRRQTLFFSATMPPEITRLADQFLKEPVRIEVARPATTAKTITQRFRFCPNGEDWAKREELRSLISNEANFKNAIVFCNRKRDVAILLKSLLKHGYNAGALHGDMDQKSRMETLDKFRSGDIKILAASDVAARGLDIPDVSHVFNFDLPWQSDDYVHRIGRTGRAGKLGTAYSLVAPDDLKLLADIGKITGDAVEWIGEGPTEDDFANVGKRRRGRNGRGNDRGRSSGSERPRSASGNRNERSGERPRRPAPERKPQADDVTPIPGIGEQPDITFNEIEIPAIAEIAAESGEKNPKRPRRRGGRGRGRNREAGVEGQSAQSTAQQRAEPEAARVSPAPEREVPRQQAPRVAAVQTPAAERPRSTGQAPNAPRATTRKGPPESKQLERSVGAAKGFADNVPAFLRRPLPKRQKVASE